MREESESLKPSSYHGTKPYVFISYAHEDSKTVYNIIRLLIRRGVRVWYDEGITIGSEFPQYIETALINSQIFIQFISPNTVESFFCRNELSLSLEIKREKTIIVYLKPTVLKYGLRLQLCNIQALYFKDNEWNANIDTLYEKLFLIDKDVFEFISCNNAHGGNNNKHQELLPFTETEDNNEYSIEIESSIDRIPPKYFKDKLHVKSVLIHDHPLEIGYGAFQGCSDLESIVLPNSLTSIPNRCFEDCLLLKDINIPSSCIKIGEKAFFHCRSLRLEEIPITLSYIGYQAFSGCDSLSVFDFQSNNLTIGDGAFYSCKNITDLSISGVSQIKKHAFHNCNALVKVNISGTLNNIEESTFEGCTSLTNVLLPDNITTIGKRAFFNCNRIKKILLPYNLKKIGPWAFSDCENLQEIIFPEAIGIIHDGAFWNCLKLSSVKLPDTCILEGNPFPHSCKITYYKNKNTYSQKRGFWST